MSVNKVSVGIYQVTIIFLFYFEMETAFYQGPHLWHADNNFIWETHLQKTNI